MNSSCNTQFHDVTVRSFAYPAVGMPEIEETEQPSAPPPTIDVERIAKEQGIREGSERAWRQYQDQLAGEREALQTAIRQFHAERGSYYQSIESEVVHLALAIARKILHREAQVDKLLLSGVVQVALGKIDAGTRVKLLVPPAELELWKDAVSRFALSERPETEPEPSIPPGSCTLRTELGELELGIEPQLKEIENGILDLLSKRPNVG